MTYTTYELISTYLNDSTLVSSDVTNYINWATDLINEKTGLIYGSDVVSSEIVDFEGGREILTEKFPLISITNVEYNSQTLDPEFNPIWTSVTSSDYYIDNDDAGTIRLKESITGGKRKLRLSYSYGLNSVPKAVEELATRLVARQILNSKLSQNINTGGNNIRIGAIQIQNAGGQSVNYFNTSLNNEINELWNTIGIFNTFKERKGNGY